MTLLSIGCLALLATSGCAAGALGQARVSSACADGDAACKPGGLDAPLAAGASTSPMISFSLRGAGAPSWQLESADPSVLVTEDGRITGVEDGLTSLMVTSEDGTVFDFFHVWVKTPTQIELAAITPGATAPSILAQRVELLPGEIIRLSTSLRGNGQPLVGDAPQTWKLSHSRETPAAVLLDEGAPYKRRLVAVAPGETKLTIESLGLTRELVIVVSDPKSAEPKNHLVPDQGAQ